MATPASVLSHCRWWQRNPYSHLLSSWESPALGPVVTWGVTLLDATLEDIGITAGLWPFLIVRYAECFGVGNLHMCVCVVVYGGVCLFNGAAYTCTFFPSHFPILFLPSLPPSLLFFPPSLLPNSLPPPLPLSWPPSHHPPPSFSLPPSPLPLFPSPPPFTSLLPSFLLLRFSAVLS